MKRWLLALVAAALLIVGVAAPASAETVVIRLIDTTNFPEVQVVAQVAGEAPTLDQFSIREGGRIVNDARIVPIGETSTPIGIVLVIDTSGSMRENSKIDAARAAARQFIAQKRPNDQLAVVAFSDRARVVVNFTADAALLTAGVNDLTASGETALWDGVRLASGLFGERPDLQPNIVLLSDGADTVSTSGSTEARAAAQGAKASVFALGLRGGEFDAAALQGLTAATGGQYAETTNPQELEALYANVQRALQNQYEITWTSQAQGVVDVTVSVAGVSASGSAPIGGASEGSANQPEAVDPSSLPSFLQGTVGKLIIGVLALVAAGLLAFGLLMLVIRTDQGSLKSVLQPYTDEPVEEEGLRSEVSFAESALIRRAVDATAHIARQRGVLDTIEKKLEQADLPLRAPEALFFTLVLAVVSVIVGGILGSFVGLVLAAIVMGLGPIVALNFLAARRRRKFAGQLPDMLQLLAGSLRAGYSLMQGVDAVAQEVSDPMGQELRRVLAEARLGRPLEEALDDAADRMQSADFSWAVMAVGIQREVGGNLAELLDTVAETMIHRERLRREVKALTAEGRVSAVILGLLPIGLGLFMFAVNRDYINRLFDTGIGQAMLGGSAVLAVAGFYWMKRIVEIEI